MTLAPTTGYTIAAERPIAPSEGSKSKTLLARKMLGGGAAGATLGAGLGAYLSGHDPVRTSLAAGIGTGLGMLHGGMKAHESTLGDKVTQERMAMREAMRAAKKEKKSSAISPIMLRGMRDELMKMAQPTAMTGAQGVVGRARQAARGAVDATAATGRQAMVPPAPVSRAVSQAQPVSKVVSKVAPKGKLTGEIAEIASKSWHKAMPELGFTGRVGRKVVGGLDRLSGGVVGTSLHTGAGARAMKAGAGHAAGVKGLQAIGKGALGAAGVGVAGAGALAYGAHRLLKGRRKAQPQPRVV